MCQDFLGNVFNSKSAMCDYYKISIQTFNRRQKLNWSLEESLITQIRDYEVIDFQNIKHKSEVNMCNYYNVDCGTYRYRIRNGWSQKDALLTPANIQNLCIDHNNNRFKNPKDMCKYWGVDYKLYHNRIKLGWTIEQALTIKDKCNKKEVEDHLGNIYTSIKSLCEKYQIPRHVYTTRLKYGWGLKDVLTTPYVVEPIIDHKGEQYSTVKEMAIKWNIPYNVLYSRLTNGWDIETCLTKNVKCSIGENVIQKYLNKYCVEYYFNRNLSRTDIINCGIFKGFEILKGLRYDFIIIKNKKLFGIIEFDGIQHFNYSKYFCKNYDDFLYRHNCDIIKTAFCKKNNIPLLRIRYDQNKNIKTLLDDFFCNPNNYIKKHNLYLDNEEYYKKFLKDGE